MASSLDSSLQKEWDQEFPISPSKRIQVVDDVEKRFSSKSKHICEICHKSFLKKLNLQRHVLIYDKAGPSTIAGPFISIAAHNLHGQSETTWDTGQAPAQDEKWCDYIKDDSKMSARQFYSKSPEMELSSVPSINEVIVDYSNRLGDFFYSGDPLVREWFLVRNDFLPFMLSIGYVIMIKIGLRLMRNRQPFDLRKPMIVFNFSLVSVYATCLVLISFYLPTVPWELFCKGGVIRKTDPSYFLLSIGWIGYLLKYIEFLDTVFFVLRKKENLVTFLHVFHHAIVPLLAWILFRTEKSALQSIPCILNCAVHVIMYTYYGLAAMGPKVRKYLWWKKYLTQLQITQFVLIIFFVLVIAPLTGCTMVMSSYLIDIIFAPLFLVLFYRFYKSSFNHAAQKIE